MSTKIPYVAYPGMIPKILNKIKEAKAPDRFTQDFLETKLGFKGGNYKQFIPLAKKLNLLNTDGTPTELYKKFRNPDTSGSSIAKAIKAGYKEVFDRNEYANDLSKDKFKGLIVEITGLEPKDSVINLICATFENLKAFANFDKEIEGENVESTSSEDVPLEKPEQNGQAGIIKPNLNLAYTINLVLPKTDDPAVFNAIFRSLRDNLLK